jgi:transposase
VIPAGVRIFVCTEPVDMRYGFDRLAQVARDRVGQDPVEGGALFVFAGKSATRLKVLWFDRNGLCLLYKRLHRAVFELPGLGSEFLRRQPAVLPAINTLPPLVATRSFASHLDEQMYAPDSPPSPTGGTERLPRWRCLASPTRTTPSGCRRLRRVGPNAYRRSSSSLPCWARPRVGDHGPDDTHPN